MITEKLINQIMSDVLARIDEKEHFFAQDDKQAVISGNHLDFGKHIKENKYAIGQFSGLIGTASGGVIGMFIANPAVSTWKFIGSTQKDHCYDSLGVLSAPGANIRLLMAIDSAAKDSNASVLKINIPSLRLAQQQQDFSVLFAGKIDDVKWVVERALEKTKNSSGEQYHNNNGFIEADYTTQAGDILTSLFNLPNTTACGLIATSSTAIDLVIADTLAKLINVNITSSAAMASYNYTEKFLIITGDANEVRQAISIAKKIAMDFLTVINV